MLDHRFQNLKLLSLALGEGVQHDALGEFLQFLPSLEELRLRYTPSSTEDIATLRDYIRSAPNLLKVRLGFCKPADLSVLVDLFIVLASQSELTSIHITAQDAAFYMPSLSTEQVYSIVAKNQTATYLSFANYVGNDVTPKVYKEFISQNHSLEGFNFCNDELENGFSLSFNRDAAVWKQVNEEAAQLLLCSRIFSAFRRSSDCYLPNEIIARCLTYSVAQSPLWIKEQLVIIIRCLRDRRTIGMIRPYVAKFDKNVLFVRCKRALAKIGA